jgi:hemerythrin
MLSPGCSTPQSQEYSFLPWVEGYAVGHDGLDTEHRRLVEIINEIHVAQQTDPAHARINTLLDMLHQETVDHLRHENSAMREVSGKVALEKGSHPAALKMMSDAVLDEHIAEHARSLQKLAFIIRSFGPESNAPSGELGDLLKDWFIEHAIKYDAHLKAVFQAL